MRAVVGGTVEPAAVPGMCRPRRGSNENACIIPFVVKARQEEAVGHSAAMQAIFEQARRIARSTAPVLITGESGTGKEVVARMIHAAGARAENSYVRVNCAALSETLIESELFGHERGAFTGAADQRIGRFEWAEDGTLLLDEISEIPLHLQAKLLRVLEEEEFQRVGGNESISMRARIVATSNRDLEQEAHEGRFREDLFYRLNVLQLELPPLRERREDIPVLIEHFLAQFCDEGEVTVRAMDDTAMSVLCDYDWPGNVRQLRNVVRRVCILARSPVARETDLPELPTPGVPKAQDLFQMTIKQASRLLVQASLRRYRGNKTAAARHLGVTTRTLHNWLKEELEPLTPAEL